MANIVDSIVGVLASSKHVIVSSDLTGNTAVSSTHPLITIKNNNSDSHGALLRLQKDTSDEANNDVTGVIQFTGNSDTGNRINFGSIDCQQTSVSNGSETGKIRFNVATSSSGTNTEVMTIQGGSHISPIVDSQIVINGSLKARLYSGNDPYELTKICNIDLGENYGYTNHILDKNHQSKITTTSTPFRVSSLITNNKFKTGLTAGTGITGGTGTIYKSWSEHFNNVIKTFIIIDMDGLRSGDTADIIGKSATGSCHIGQITNAICGNVFKMKITCLEVPAGGSLDIDFYTATVATGTEDTLITALTETKVLEYGQNWAVGNESLFNVKLKENEYLYMVNGGSAVDAEYTTGQFLIEIFGYKNITPATGITSIYKSWIENEEDVNKIKTTIYIDLKDLESEATLADIIGNIFTDATCDYNNDPTITMDSTTSIAVGMSVRGTGIPDGATVASITNSTTFELSAATTGGAVTNGTLTFSAPAHIGQINYSQTGIIYNTVIECIETPVGGEVDIDVYQSTVDSGTGGNLVTSLANSTQLLNTAADWTAGTSKTFTTNPSDENYLYLSVGTSSSPTAGTYTAGKYLIHLYGTPLDEVSNITSFVTCYDIDFGSGFKMSTGSTTGSYIDLCSQNPSYTCTSGRSWWIETQFKLNDFDATEFFFGIAEPNCGDEDLIFVSSTTFVKAAGKDRVGLSKLTHNSTAITAGITKNTDGNESLALTNNITYNKDNSIITLGIYWDGTSNIYFYGNSRDSGSVISNTSLLFEYQSSSINVVPNDSSNYLRLFINNGEAVSKKATINYIRGKILIPNSTTIYSY